MTSQSDTFEKRLATLEGQMTGKVDKWQFQLVLGTLMTIVAAILSFLTYMMFRLDDKVDIVQESQHQVAREVSEISGVLNTIDFINLK